MASSCAVNLDDFRDSIQRFLEVLDAATVPHTSGRRVTGIATALALSNVTDELCNAAGRVQSALIESHGVDDTPSEAAEGVKLLTSSITSNPLLFAAVENVIPYLAYPANQQHRRQRWHPNDVVSSELLAAVDSASKLIKLATDRATPVVDDAPSPMNDFTEADRLRLVALLDGDMPEGIKLTSPIYWQVQTSHFQRLDDAFAKMRADSEAATKADLDGNAAVAEAYRKSIDQHQRDVDAYEPIVKRQYLEPLNEAHLLIRKVCPQHLDKLPPLYFKQLKEVDAEATAKAMTTVLGCVLSMPRQPQPSTWSAEQSTQDVVDAFSNEFGVPVEVLKGLSRIEERFEAANAWLSANGKPTVNLMGFDRPVTTSKLERALFVGGLRNHEAVALITTLCGSDKHQDCAAWLADYLAKTYRYTPEQIDTVDLASLLPFLNMALAEQTKVKATNGDVSPTISSAVNVATKSDLTLTDTATASDAETPTKHALYRQGSGFWIEGFGKSGFAKDILGFGYLSLLVAKPGCPITMADLVESVTRTQIPKDPRSVQEAIDSTGRQALKARREKLVEELEDAKADGQQWRIDAAEQEIKQIEDELKSAAGWKGKGRDLNNSQLNRYRARIHARLTDAYQLLRGSDLNMNDLAEHFECTISSGSGTFVYSPAGQTISWQTEK